MPSYDDWLTRDLPEYDDEEPEIDDEIEPADEDHDEEQVTQDAENAYERRRGY